ncbi:MAG: DUF2059 domain-containing protein [Ignavibacteria bacterium]|nr:DUF2059 domain-containing protein [Ignavibacteria bacterium]
MIKNQLKFIAITIALIIISSHGGLAQKNSAASQEEKNKNIVKLLELNGTSAFGEKVFVEIVNALKKNYTSIPDAFWKNITKDISPVNMAIKAIPAYDKRFTNEEIKDLITFFQTPTGKKYIASNNEVGNDVKQLWKEWGETFTNSVTERLKELANKNKKK